MTPRIKTVGVLAVAAFLAGVVAGCVTERDKVAVARTCKVLAADSSPQAQASAVEIGEVAKDIGADKVDPAAAPVTPEAALENARGIAREREGREVLVSVGGSLLGKILGAAAPWATALGALASGLWAIWRKGQVQRVAVALSGAYEAVKTGNYQDGMTKSALEAAGASLELAQSIRELAAKKKA